MLIGAVIVAAILMGLSGYAIRAGFQEWREAGTPMSQRSATARMTVGTRAGIDRAGVPLGLSFACAAVVMIVGAIVAAAHARYATTGAAGRVIVVVPLTGLIIFTGLTVAIVEFNRPRFLVPRQHRDEPGAFAAGRRHSKSRVAGSAVPAADAAGRPGPLADGEQIRARFTANHIDHGRGFEGFLYVTSERLVHLPWPASEARGGTSWEIPHAEVAAVDLAPRGRKWRDGSLRRRLRISTQSGDPELFVVWRPRRTADLVEHWRRGG